MFRFRKLKNPKMYRVISSYLLRDFFELPKQKSPLPEIWVAIALKSGGF
jgi:hypothetical protein